MVGDGRKHESTNWTGCLNWTENREVISSFTCRLVKKKKGGGTKKKKYTKKVYRHFKIEQWEDKHTAETKQCKQNRLINVLFYF